MQKSENEEKIHITFLKRKWQFYSQQNQSNKQQH
jgi:hypothetical protein